MLDLFQIFGFFNLTEKLVFYKFYFGWYIDFQQKLLEIGSILNVKRLFLQCMPWWVAECWVIFEIASGKSY